jgi:hypothetical protein
MSSVPASDHFLDQALDGYRAGVKAWSRDVLLSGLALLLAGALILAPFLRWSTEGQSVELERDQLRAQQATVNTALSEVERMVDAVGSAKRDLAEAAEQLAAELSERLRGFAALVTSLGQAAPDPAVALAPPPGVPNAPPNFPGVDMTQQFAQPNAPWQQMDQQNVLLAPPEPSEELRSRFGLDRESLDQLREAFREGQGSPAWQAASTIAEGVFKSEIERTYAELEGAVDSRLAALQTQIGEGLSNLQGSASTLGVTLPAADQIAPKSAVVHLPSDDQLFRTVGGKVEAFRNVALYELGLDLDAAEAPLRDVARVIAESGARLNQQRERLEQRRAEIARELEALDERLAAVRAELGTVAGPLQWLALDTATFVRVYPTLLALAALWLAHRLARLRALRQRIESDYRARGLSERDIRLGLYVPEAALGGLGSPSAKLARFARPAAAVALLFGIIAVVLWIQRSPAAASGWAWQIPAVLLGILACFTILNGREA